MTEAGFSAAKKLKVKTQTSASGSGQMLPLPMNEFVQQSLAECFFDVELDVIEWNTLFTNWRKGAKDESARGSHATNVTYAAMDPFFAMIRFLDSRWRRRTSNNWGFINDPEFDKLAAAVRVAFDPAARDKALAALHERSVDAGGVPLMSRMTSVGARHVRRDQELRAAEELVRRLLRR
jgi:ABC-type transport system substrate-binding protein